MEKKTLNHDQKSELSLAARARLLRVAEAHGLSDDLKAELTLELSDPVNKVEVLTEYQSARMTESRDVLNLKIRNLISQNAPWSELGGVVWRRYLLTRDDEAAAKALEMAFLYAQAGDLDQWLIKLTGEHPHFYLGIHLGVRLELLKIAEAHPQFTGVSGFLIPNRSEQGLLGSERLFILDYLTARKDPSPAFHYFRAYELEIRAAIEQGKLSKSKSYYYLMCGKLAHHMGYVDLAREILHLISEGTPEKEEAGIILLRSRKDTYGVHEAYWREELLNLPTPEARLERLREILKDLAEKGAVFFAARTALNEILRDPFVLSGHQPSHVRILSEILCENRELRVHLPNLLNVFNLAQFNFGAKDFELSLWGPLSEKSGVDAYSDYWAGVAKLHLFIALGPSEESLLWEGRNLIIRAKNYAREPLPSDWKNLHKNTYQYVVKTPRLLELDRDLMLKALRVAVDLPYLATVDLEDYLAKPKLSCLIACQNLIEAARIKGLPQFEAQFILKAGLSTHLTNSQLKRLFVIAAQGSEHDVAWRVLTILKARLVLPAAASHAWEISGEKRSHYGFTVPSREEVDLCLDGLSPEGQRLSEAFLTLSGKLTELLSLLDPGVSKTRWLKFPKDTIEFEVDQALSNVSWLERPKKRFLFSYDSVQSHTQIPAFMQVLPSNPWSLTVARIAEYLGVNAFGFKLARLRDELADLVVRVAGRQDLKHQSGSLAAWLRSLTPEQRRAWQDLQVTLKSIGLDYQTPADEVAIFICRLATLLTGAHYSALTSLEAMRAPIAVRWQLESWLLSRGYSNFRTSHGLSSRVMVPKSVKTVF